MIDNVLNTKSQDSKSNSHYFLKIFYAHYAIERLNGGMCPYILEATFVSLCKLPF